MNVMIPVPDAFAVRFGSEAELGRRALEALVLQEVRAGRLPWYEVQSVLDFPDFASAEAFLDGHGLGRTAEEKAAGAKIVASFRAFAKEARLGGLDVKALIAEGRR